jgi:predicted O-methyltransferase YrrM
MGLSLQVQQVLAELEAFGQANDQQQTDRAHKMLNLERETAELLRAFVLSARRKRVLEIGTSNGYSAIWLGSTLQGIAGSTPLLTIEKARASTWRCGPASPIPVLNRMRLKDYRREPLSLPKCF